MATATQADYAVTTAWTDLAATITGAASVACLIQNLSDAPVQIVWGGASAPATTHSGVTLNKWDSMAGTAAKIWVRAPNGATVSTTLT